MTYAPRHIYNKYISGSSPTNKGFNIDRGGPKCCDAGAENTLKFFIILLDFLT